MRRKISVLALLATLVGVLCGYGKSSALEASLVSDTVRPIDGFLASPVFIQTAPYQLLEFESLGIPAEGLVPFEGLGINVLKLWNGRIYIGHGEGTINTGPTEIISFDPATMRFLNEYLTDENGSSSQGGTESRQARETSTS